MSETEARIIDRTTMELVLGDIAEQNTEVIVNTTNECLAPGGGVSGARVGLTGEGDQ